MLQYLTKSVFPKVKKYFFPSACFLLIGAGVVSRFIMIRHPFEYDEIYTAVTADPSLSLFFVIKQYLLQDMHPPFHFIFLWFYNHVVPYGPEWILRLPSLVAGLLAVWFSWRLFPVRYGKTARYIFTVMCSTNFFTIFYAEQARSYAFLFLEGVLLLTLVLRMLPLLVRGRKIARKYWGSYAVLLSLLMWTHYIGALVAVIVAAVWFLTACYYRRYRLISFLVPVGALALFSIWLIPNFFVNRSLARFNGAWWGNSLPTEEIIPTMAALFVRGIWIYCGFVILWALGMLYAYYKCKRRRLLPHVREWVFLTAVIVLVLSAATVLLKVFHMSFFISRYFTAMLPFVYALFALCVTAFVRRFIVVQIIFVALVVWSFVPTVKTLFHCKYEYGFLAKVTSQLIQKNAPGKKLYVITNITFPVNSMESLYGFYLNRRFGLNVPVFELYKRPLPERESLLASRQDAVIWVPKCDPRFLTHVAKSWGRQIGVEGFIYNAGCIIQMSDRGYSLNPPVVFLFNKRGEGNAGKPAPGILPSEISTGENLIKN